MFSKFRVKLGEILFFPMKIKSLVLTLVLGFLLGIALTGRAQARVTFSFFYDTLQPHGVWLDVENYGYCWQPRGLERSWRPYTDGYWSYTDAGWTWVSYEAFGAITYHYGRWVNLEDYGWVWRPGYEWGPAWVSWRQGEDCIGWAPLPPEAEFDPEVGIGTWADRDYEIGPSAYVFCETRYFGSPMIRNVMMPRSRSVEILPGTVNITNITVVTDGRDHRRVVFNGGLDYRRVCERTERRIETLELMRQTDGDWMRGRRLEPSRRVGGQLYVIAPEVEVPRERFAPPMVSHQIRAPRIDRGWVDVADPSARERILQRYQEETRGMTRMSSPATRVDAQQVQTLLREARARQEQIHQAEQVQKAVQKQVEKAEKWQQKVQEVQQIQRVQQAQQAQQVQREQIELQRKAAEAQAHVAREQAELQRKAAEAQARAVREQAEQARDLQRAQQGAQHRALEKQQEMAQRLQEAQQEQARKIQKAQQEQAIRQAHFQQKVLEVQQRSQQSPVPDSDDLKKKRKELLQQGIMP